VALCTSPSAALSLGYKNADKWHTLAVQILSAAHAANSAAAVPITTQGEENADKCQGTFNTTYTTDSGAVANMNLGGVDYLIQQVSFWGRPHLHCKCAWTFGSTYTTSSGAQANMKLGGQDYLIQQVSFWGRPHLHCKRCICASGEDYLIQQVGWGWVEATYSDHGCTVWSRLLWNEPQQLFVPGAIVDRRYSYSALTDYLIQQVGLTFQIRVAKRLPKAPHPGTANTGMPLGYRQ
jgi:hypothetical protein